MESNVGCRGFPPRTAPHARRTSRDSPTRPGPLELFGDGAHAYLEVRRQARDQAPTSPKAGRRVGNACTTTRPIPSMSPHATDSNSREALRAVPSSAPAQRHHHHNVAVIHEGKNLKGHRSASSWGPSAKAFDGVEDSGHGRRNPRRRGEPGARMLGTLVRAGEAAISTTPPHRTGPRWWSRRRPAGGTCKPSVSSAWRSDDPGASPGAAPPAKGRQMNILACRSSPASSSSITTVDSGRVSVPPHRASHIRLFGTREAAGRAARRHPRHPDGKGPSTPHARPGREAYLSPAFQRWESDDPDASPGAAPPAKGRQMNILACRSSQPPSLSRA